MSKTFKISAIAASLLVSGILVGCGSSNDGSSTPGPTPGPGPTPVAKTLTVTDDYVLGASVFSIPTATSSKARGTYNATNGTILNPEDAPGDKDGDKDKPDSNTTTPVQPTKDTIIKPVTNSKGSTEKGMGKYEFADLKPADVAGSNGGTVDLNGNGKADAGEPKALSMATKGSYSYMNPFTTLEVLTNGDVKALFGIEKTDIDTTGTDAKTRKAVAFANAIIAEAQFNSAKYGGNAGGNTGGGTGGGSGDKDLFPLTAKNAILEKVLENINKSMTDDKLSLAEAVAKLTGKDGYKTLGDDAAAINEFIKAELLRYGGESKKPVTPVKEDNKDSLFPL